jgi:DNA polymerase III subunit delta'
MAQPLIALRDIVGHTGAVRLLARLVDRERLPHAVILEGPQGSGRRTLARAVAAALLCPERQAGDACGQCAHCMQAAAGTHPDITEMPGSREAPGGMPVDAARAVAEAASSSPLLGIGKAIIVPDAERLRGASANALLKILEEPPPRTTLMLTAASAASLLGTIRSRAQVYRLQALTQAEIAKLLVRKGVNPARAAILAAAGSGVRAADATTLPPAPLVDLEQILAGLDLAAVARVIAMLPSKIQASNEDGEESDDLRTPAAVQRACLRDWLLALNTQIRNGLRSPDPRIASISLERLERIARAIGDLDRNHTPRLALESLALGR